jgi:hypothetical protein
MISEVKAAGDYLLSVLKTEKSVAYSRFYNAVPGTDVALVEGIWPFLMSQSVEHRGELDDNDKQKVREQVYMLLEWAAWQLEDLGVVKISWLDDSKLINDEPDFRIELTDRGTRFIEDRETFGYREPEDTMFNVSEASKWMLTLLHEGGPGQTLTLCDVMDPDHTSGLTLVTDDYGNKYSHGSNTYVWAFEVCLWHHVRNKHIEPVFENAEHRDAWEAYVRHESRPPRPDSSVGRPLWHVPFRLVEGVDPDRVQHVGRIG